MMMADRTGRTVCPDCGMQVMGKNLEKHYRRQHPGLDPYVRLKETRAPRKPRRSVEVSSSTAMIIATVVVAVMLIVLGTLVFLAFYEGPDEGQKEPRNIWFTSSDGAIINGTWYASKKAGAPTVYLVHDIGSDRTIWMSLPVELQKDGCNVLAIDLRGHGGSRLNVKSADIYYDWTEMDLEDLEGIFLDIQGAYRWVHADDDDGHPNTDAGADGALVGIGQGGLFAFDQASKMSRERILSAVLISPTMDCYGLDVVQSAENWGDVRPVTFISSEEDGTSVAAVDAMMARREENGIDIRVEGNAKGEMMLENPDVIAAILNCMEEGWAVTAP